MIRRGRRCAVAAGTAFVLLGGAQSAGAAVDWSNPVLLSSGTLRSAPVLAVDAHGDAFAAWTAYDGSGTNTDRTAIEATQRSASGAFVQPEILQTQDPDPSNPAEGGGDTPSIGVADSGTATLAWRPIGNDRPVAATRTLSADWTPPAPLAKDAGDATGQVFVEPGGHAAAVVAGGCLTTNLEDPDDLACLADGDGQGTADVLTDGSALMATLDAGLSDTTLIDVRTLAAGGTGGFGSAVTVATVPADMDAFDLQIKVTGSGDAYLAFLATDAAEDTSLELATLHAGVWSPPTTVSQDVDRSYSLAVDRGSGSAILAWAQEGTTTDAVEASTTASPTTPLSSPVTLDADADPFPGVSAAASGAGTGVVAWAHSDDSVRASLLSSDGFGAAETVSAPDDQATAITAAARGVPALLWTAQDGAVQTVESATANAPSGPTQQAPVCFDTTGQVLRNGSQSIGLACSDAAGLPITISIVNGPTHGSLDSIEQGSRSVQYTPNAGYTGTDTFAYQASDGTRTSAVAHATIQVVFHPPVCGTVTTTETNVPVTIPLTCVNPDGYPLTWSIVTPPQHGVLSPIAGGRVVYTPDSGYAGDDSFKYAAMTPDGTSYPGTADILVYATPSWWTSGGGGFTVTPGGCLGLTGTESLLTCWVVLDCPPLGGACTIDGGFGGSGGDSGDMAGDAVADHHASALSRIRPRPLAKPFRITLGAGAKRKVHVKLTRAGRAQLEKRGRLTLVLHLSIRQGGRVVTETNRIRIKLVKRRRRRHA